MCVCVCVCDRVLYSGMLGELVGSHTNVAIYPTYTICCKKVVICALLNTGFKGIQVVNYPTNYQTTKVMLTKVFPKSLGACTWINKVHSSSRIYSCSTRGTDIARVEGQWLNKGPNHSVPETKMTALRLELAFLIYFPPPIAQDITVWSSALLFLWENHCPCAEEMPLFFATSAGITAKIPSYYRYTWTISSFPYPEFCACDTLPQIFWCTLIPEPWIYSQHLRTDKNTDRYK